MCLQMLAVVCLNCSLLVLQAVVGDLASEFAEVAPAGDPNVVQKLVADGKALLQKRVVEEMSSKAAEQASLCSHGCSQ